MKCFGVMEKFKLFGHFRICLVDPSLQALYLTSSSLQRAGRCRSASPES